MPRSGVKTRERIADAAEALVYRHGFAATSIEKVISDAGITKGTFFYHFSTKADLGRELVQRYARRDLEHLERTLSRAARLSNDPRQQVLIFVGLLQEDFSALPDPMPGCLFTSYLYETAEYPADVAEIARQTFAQWRDRVAGLIEKAGKVGEVAEGIDPTVLANTLLALIEGGFVLAKAQNDAAVLVELLGQFRKQLAQILGIEPDA